jgi:HK97 family phage prohead protease
MSENLGGFREKIDRGAFTKSLEDGDEVHALFNHDNNKILGRRGAGTLKLWEDDHGLRVEINPPNTTDGNDVVELLRRGDLVSMSFGFYNVKDTWETRDDEDIRTINEAKLFDVSVVTNPAYYATEVNVRSHTEYVASKELETTNFEVVGETIDLRLKLRLAEEG